MAAGYRFYIWGANKLEIQTKVCYQVNRGYNQPPVESCEGNLRFQANLSKHVLSILARIICKHETNYTGFVLVEGSTK